MLTDYKVQWRSSESIKATALRWIKAAVVSGLGPRANIVTFIQKVLGPQIEGGLRIRFFRKRDTNVAPASVTFNPLTLHVEERIWRQAQSPKLTGHEDARHIIAHEIGHLVLHRDQRKAFSAANGEGRFYSREESSEWQANAFAKFSLIGESTPYDYLGPEELSTTLRIPFGLAVEVVEERDLAALPGDFCQICGALAQIRSGQALCARCEYESFRQHIAVDKLIADEQA